MAAKAAFLHQSIGSLLLWMITRILHFLFTTLHLLHITFTYVQNKCKLQVFLRSYESAEDPKYHPNPQNHNQVDVRLMLATTSSTRSDTNKYWEKKPGRFGRLKHLFRIV